MSGRFGHALKAVVLGALAAGSILGITAGSAAAHDRDWGRGGERYDREHGRQWYPPDPYYRGEWREHRRHGRDWREPRVIYAPPPPVIYMPPPRPRVIYAPPPVVYAPAPGFGLSVNIR